MKISLIVAMAEDGGIGLNNQLPWHLPEDLKNFRRITMGKPILMGRNTWDSLGRPLPGRENVVISSRPVPEEGCLHYGSIPEALGALAEYQEIMLIGGASLYRQMLDQVDQLYVTRVAGCFAADTFFPAMDWSEWALAEEECFEVNDERPLAYRFQRYQRHAGGRER